MAPTTALAAKKPVTAREIEAVVRAASASVTAALAAGDAPRAAMAAATLALAAQKSSGPGGDDALCCAAGPLVAALDAGGGPGDVPGVAKNAAAALAAAVQAGGEDVAAAALGVGAVKAASNLATRAASVEGEWTNAVALLGALAGSGDAGALAVVQGGGLDAILPLLDPAVGDPGNEGGADALCACLTCDGTRETVAAAGAPRALGLLLAAAPPPQTRCLALMALAMLLPGRAGAQADVVRAPGALAALVAAMRQGADADARAVARELYAVLAADEGARPAMVAALSAGGGGDGTAGGGPEAAAIVEA